MNGKIENNFKQTAATLAEALPYIQRYEDSTIVIKLGGHAMTSKPSMENFARDIVLIKQCGVNPVIVCLLYTSPSPRDPTKSRMPSSA